MAGLPPPGPLATRRGGDHSGPDTIATGQAEIGVSPVLDCASASPAAGTLEASVMALIQLPPQPRRDLGRLRAHCCFNEKSGVRGWLRLGGGRRGPEGAGSGRCPPTCPRQLRAALPPPRALPVLAASWRGLGTPEETEIPHLQGTLGPTHDEELGAHGGA